MRHNKKFNHLGRTASHRKAMLANMATSLIIHKRISTTIAKAKALRIYVEPLITKSKEDTTHSRRIVFSYLKQKEAVSELFREISPRIATRPGGYTRILKTGFRQGDAADMCIIELVDFNETYNKDVKLAEKPKTRRSRSGAAAKAVKEGSVAQESVEATAGKAEKPAAKKAPAKKAAETKTKEVEAVAVEMAPEAMEPVVVEPAVEIAEVAAETAEPVAEKTAGDDENKAE